MKRSIFYLMLVLVFTISACQGDKEVTSVKYEIGQCCNFYDEANNCFFIGILESAICFFEEKDIEISELEVMEEGVIAVCATCCRCPQGQSLLLEVADEDLEELLDLGFTLN